MKNKPKLYFAAPLFSYAERSFNEQATKLLEEYFEVFLPQRDGGLMDEMIKDGMSVSKASKTVFDIDVKELSASDVVVGVLDGNSIDEGVAIELGFAYALEIKCIGLQTAYSEPIPPLIPTQIVHPFRSNSATDSD
jgi:nucleoside 2-deoxyribosyltransferase